jgi:serine/threonine protein kinase
MKLTLQIPKSNDTIYPEDCLTPVHEENPYMKYWITKSGKFCKTPKDLGIKLAEALKNEIKVINFLKSKPISPVINPPSRFYFLDGKIVIEQNAIIGTDFFDYVANNNHGLYSSIALLKCVKSAMIYFNMHKMIFNDFALENFMVRDHENMELVLVDFGFSQIYDEDKDYVWSFKKVATVRKHQLSPDILMKYNDSQKMNRDQIFDLYQKKDLFSIGVILFSTFFGSELWDPTQEHTPMKKYNDIIRLHQVINRRLNDSAEDQVTKLILRLILKLIPYDIFDIISLKEFVFSVSEIEELNNSCTRLEQPNKRMRLI